MRILAPALMFFLLACGGMMGVFIPDIPVELPSDARTFVGKVDEQGDRSTTRVSGISPSAKAADLERTFRDQLVADGWGVTSQSSDEGSPIVLTGTRGAESLVITLESDNDVCSYEVVWSR